MKNFTLLTAVILIAGMNTANAQQRFKHHHSAGSKMEELYGSARKQGDFKVRKAHKADAQSLWRPAKETEYFFEEDWEKSATYEKTYTADGLLSVQIVDDGYALNRTTYTYNANGKKTSEVQEVSEDGGEYVVTQKTEQSYDEFITDLVISKEVWADWGAGLMNTHSGHSRTINRDDKNRVTMAAINAYHGENLEPIEKQTVTYDPATGFATTVAHESLEMTDDETFEFMEDIRLTNIVWDRTNGQLAREYTFWFEGDNRLKSADIIEQGETVGSISVVYSEDGGYIATIEYDKLADLGYPNERMVMKLEYTDDNGSLVYTSTGYYDMNEDGVVTIDEVEEMNKTVIGYDAYGNETLYEEYMMPEPGMEPELMGGTKTEYTYDEEKQCPMMTVYNEFMGDYDDDGNPCFLPMMKLVVDEFVNVKASGIKTTAATTASGTTVYSVEGVKFNTNSLPSGIYIVNRNGKNVKIMKR